MVLFPEFDECKIILPSSIALYVRRGGYGPPVLLLHGYPETSACWHVVAPYLVSAGFEVIAPDLRGYGASDKPVSSTDHMTYSKRVMAQDLVELMQKLGHERFHVAGHDRGGRVAHRLALDHPHNVICTVFLDIAPTTTMYATADMEFARAYYHWFFLIQPALLPEKLIAGAPELYLRTCLMSWGVSEQVPFSAEALNEYYQSFRDPACMSATCEDYRASASIDLEHDNFDKKEKIQAPLLVLWGARSFVGTHYDVIRTWQDKAVDVRGHAIQAGHFLPEEDPKNTAEALITFFRATSDNDQRV